MGSDYPRTPQKLADLQQKVAQANLDPDKDETPPKGVNAVLLRQPLSLRQQSTEVVSEQQFLDTRLQWRKNQNQDLQKNSSFGRGRLPFGEEKAASGGACPVTEAAAAQGTETNEVPLLEFSVLSEYFGTAAASRPMEELSPSVRHALLFIRNVSSLPESVQSLPSSLRRSVLPPLDPRTAKPTLVLDLDETLVHCSRGENRGCPRATLGCLNSTPDLIVKFDDGPTGCGNVYFRPYVRYFLEMCARDFEVVLFTASQQAYADKVIQCLDPLGCLIDYSLYRHHCTEHRGAYFKDLALLGRQLNQCILVDNSPISVAVNADHGVLCRSWYGDRDDKELMSLLDLLQTLLEVRRQGNDMDRYLAQRFGFKDFFQALRVSAGHRC